MYDETDIGILSGGVDHAGGLTSADPERRSGIVARKRGAVAWAAARREAALGRSGL
ncbi:MAG: hypothetical protein R3D84_07890 [Paracoccaceae bacterium]